MAEDGETRKNEAEMTASLGGRPDSPAAALEDDDLLEEILLRLPALPSSVPRASLVCARWRRLVSDPGFLRRFRHRHRRSPPLVGFFAMVSHDLHFIPTMNPPDRVPPGRLSLHFDEGHDKPILLGSRHGLVIILHKSRKEVLVWDPVTSDQHSIALPPGFAGYMSRKVIHGAVLRAAGDVRHFQVVLILADDDDLQHRRALVFVYSSEAGVWGDLVSTPLPPKALTDRVVFVYSPKPAVLVENRLYWMLTGDLNGILEFDLERKSVAVIPPPVDVFTLGRYEFSVMPAESGGLGFLFVSKSYCAQLWKRKTVGDGVASWVLERSIELERLIPMDAVHLYVKGFAEENNVVILWKELGVFTIPLESLQFNKLPDPYMIGVYHSFESVYAAETCVRGGHGGAELLLNTSTG